MSHSKDITPERKAKRLAATRAWRARNKEKIAAYNKTWQEANGDKKAAQQAARRKADPDLYKAKYLADREKNPTAGAAKTKAYRQRHTEKVKTAAKAYRAANPEKIKAKKRRSYHRNAAAINLRHKCRKYGLTRDELDRMVAECNGRCPCCGSPFSDLLKSKNHRPVIDHDHRKGFARDAVRGVICHQCNITIGHAGDNPAILRACARHLERHQKASKVHDPESAA